MESCWIGNFKPSSESLASPTLSLLEGLSEAVATRFLQNLAKPITILVSGESSSKVTIAHPRTLC